jgi:hypothetical protein
VVQWLLAALLLLGLTGMHHLPTAEAGVTLSHAVGCCEVIGADHEPHRRGEPTPAHDLVHLCSAVIVAASVALLVLWLLLRSVRQPRLLIAGGLAIGRFVRRRGPPLSAPVRLAFLGVFRH